MNHSEMTPDRKAIKKQKLKKKHKNIKSQIILSKNW